MHIRSKPSAPCELQSGFGPSPIFRERLATTFRIVRLKKIREKWRHTEKRVSAKGHVWTTPALQEESDVRLAVGASHVPGLLRGIMTAGSDVVRGSGPNHSHGL